MYGWAPGAKGFACVPSNPISDDFGIFLATGGDGGPREACPGQNVRPRYVIPTVQSVSEIETR